MRKSTPLLKIQYTDLVSRARSPVGKARRSTVLLIHSLAHFFNLLVDMPTEAPSPIIIHSLRPRRPAFTMALYNISSPRVIPRVAFLLTLTFVDRGNGNPLLFSQITPHSSLFDWECSRRRPGYGSAHDYVSPSCWPSRPSLLLEISWNPTLHRIIRQHRYLRLIRGPW